MTARIHPTAIVDAKADAYVRADKANQNYGNKTRLHSKTESKKSRRVYLKFDISDLTTNFSSAKLKLFGGGPDIDEDIVASVHKGKSSKWSEKKITWNNQVGVRKKALDTANLSKNGKKWVSFDIAEYLRKRIENGKKTITLVIKAKPKSALWALFNSDEAAGHKPRLVLKS